MRRAPDGNRRAACGHFLEAVGEHAVAEVDAQRRSIGALLAPTGVRGAFRG